MTPDEVFLVLLESHREGFDLPPGDEEDLRPDYPLRDWMTLTVGDLDRPSSVFKFVNAVFATEYSRSSWDSFARGGYDKTVWDACEFIARSAQVPDIQPRRILGMNCLAAGVFETTRELLEAEGVDRALIAPSTPLSMLASRPFARAVQLLWRASPPLRKELKFQWPDDGCFLLLGAFLLLATLPAALIATVRPLPFLLLPFIVFSAFLAVWHWSVVRQKQGPDAVRFKSLKTVADLCRLVASEPEPARKR